MAAPPFENPLPTLSHNPLFFDIYTDGAVAVPAPILPGGPCGFVDLTPGANGARCGCRRFWSRPLPANQVRAFPESPGSDQAYWCMCSHHACYHEDVPLSAHAPATAAAATPSAAFGAGQENERPRANREPLTPVQDTAPFRMPNTAAGLGVTMEMPPGFILGAPSFTAAMDHAAGAVPPASADGHGSIKTPIAGSVSAPEGSLPDTLAWANMPQSNNGAPSGLPPIPSQCLVQSQSPSTAPSSQLRYLRPFAGKGLNTLKGKGLVDQDAQGGVNGQQASAAIDHDATIPNTQASPQEQFQMPTAPTPKAAWYQSFSQRPLHFSGGLIDDDAMRSLKDTVAGHGQRLDKLENPTFSVAGHDECGDKLDQTDLRVTDLESRVEEVEKRLNDDNSTVVSSSRRDDGTASVVSDSTHAFSDRQIYSQLQELQAQVNKLQASSLPTYNSPWELEVVLLPFCLKGVWMPAHEFQSQRPSGAAPWDANGDEWTQMPNTHSRQTPDPTSPYIADWLDQSSTSTWLLPRACAPGRVIDSRLRSRGLIRTLSVKGSDARSVHLAVVDAFNNMLQILCTGSASQPSSRLVSAKLDRFLGLGQPWVPLRKLHKDSRLRFLSPAEMLTPTLWDVGFLSSSVVMKATGMHRLYITQPEAYLQDHLPGRDGAWTWQKLRELGRICPDSQSSSASTVDASVDAEECWRWHDRLDEPPAAPSPELEAQQQRHGAAGVANAGVANKSRSTAASSSQVFYTAQSPLLARGKSPAPVREQRSGSRPPHLRTTSVPIGGLPSLVSSAGGSQPRKARGVSYTSATKSSPYERRPSPFVAGPSRPSPRLQMVSTMVSKRRRSGAVGPGAAHSPSVRQRMSPRWSTASFSRSPSVMPREMSAAPEDQRMRGTTPFCYATPYSTAPIDAPRGGGDYGARATSVGPAAEAYKAGLRPAGMRYNDEDDDMDYNNYDDDHGSNSDDLDMSDGFNFFGDENINVYEDFSGDEDDKDEQDDDAGSSRRRRSGPGPGSQQEPDGQVNPEDEPWPGIEDIMSDGENVDPARLSSSDEAAAAVELDNLVDDAASDVSSQPSEYPSNQRAWHMQEAGLGGGAGGGSGGRRRDSGAGAGFTIHEDEDADGHPVRW